MTNVVDMRTKQVVAAEGEPRDIDALFAEAKQAGAKDLVVLAWCEDQCFYLSSNITRAAEIGMMLDLAKEELLSEVRGGG